MSLVREMLANHPIEEFCLRVRPSFLTFPSLPSGLPCEEEREAGTTATVALLRNSVQLAVAHVGDSRALIYRKGEVK